MRVVTDFYPLGMSSFGKQVLENSSVCKVGCRQSSQYKASQLTGYKEATLAVLERESLE